MAKSDNLRGSTGLGAVFLLSVFGPMFVLAILWALAAGVGQSGATRDAFMNAMIWVLMVSGVVLVIEEVLLIAATSLRRSGQDGF